MKKRVRLCFDDASGVLTVELRGRIGPDDLARGWDRAFEAHGRRGLQATLWDLSGPNRRLSLVEQRVLAVRIARDATDRRIAGRVAVVADEMSRFEAGRHFQALIPKESKMILGVFGSREAALAFLTGEAWREQR